MMHEDVLEYEVAKTSRVLGYVVAMCLAADAVLLIGRMKLPADAVVVDGRVKALLWTVGLLPSWIFVGILGVAAVRQRAAPSLWRAGSIATALALPALLAIFYHDLPSQLFPLREGVASILLAGIASALVGIVWLENKAPERSSELWVSLLNLAFQSIWYVWTTTEHRVPTLPRAPHRRTDGGKIQVPEAEFRLRAERRLYSLADGLEAFQETFGGRELDPPRIVPSLAEQLRVRGHSERTGLRILDVGGAEGVFTCGVVKQVRRILPSGTTVDVHCIEPAATRDAYLETLQSVADGVRFQPAELSAHLSLTPSTYDLIVASHSLYSCLDDSEEQTVGVLGVLRKALANQGSLLVLLSSNRSRYWHCREALRTRLLGESQIHDACAEAFKEIVERREQDIGMRVVEEVVLDNVLRLDSVLDDSRRELLRKWISYCLRIPAESLTEIQLAVADNTLTEWAMDGAHLPEVFLSQLTSMRGDRLEDVELILPHKSVAYWLAPS